MLGLLARYDRRSIGLGYFFDSWFADQPALLNAIELRRRSARLVCRFGDAAIRRGRWIDLGLDPAWDRAAWPLPDFRRDDLVTGLAMRVAYAADDLLEPLREERLSLSDGVLPKNDLYGPGAVEIVLTAACQHDGTDVA